MTPELRIRYASTVDPVVFIDESFQLDRNDTFVVAFHARPSEEPLLALADILAWSFRQEHARNESRWFEPLREHTEVTRIS